MSAVVSEWDVSGCLRQVCIEKMSESELPMTCRNTSDVVETGGAQNHRDEVCGKSDYYADDNRHIGSMSSIQASTWNVGTCRSMLRESSKR